MANETSSSIALNTCTAAPGPQAFPQTNNIYDQASTVANAQMYYPTSIGDYVIGTGNVGIGVPINPSYIYNGVTSTFIYPPISSVTVSVDDGVKSPMTLRIDENILEHLRHLARHLSFHLDKDYTHQDIVRQLVNKLFSAPHNEYAAKLQKESVLNLFNDEPEQPNYVYIGPVAVKTCTCDHDKNEACTDCPPEADSPLQLFYKQMARHDLMLVGKMSYEHAIEWKKAFLVKQKYRQRMHLDVTEPCWHDAAAEYLKDLLDSIVLSEKDYQDVNLRVEHQIGCEEPEA